MNRVLLSFFMVIGSGTNISCAQVDVLGRSTKMPKPELEQVKPADFSYAKIYKEAVSVLSDPNKCSDCKSMSGTFMIFHDIHYGYSLSREDELQNSIIPVIVDKQVLKKFNDFFSEKSLLTNMGKRIYCECAGNSLNRYESTFYRIREARLFAR